MESKLFARLCKGGLACLMAVSMPFTVLAAASEWPSKPIRMLVPFAPGGATDILGRLIANELSKDLGQSIVVENRPGAGGNIGSDVVARSKADGYTLLFGAAGNIAINPALFKNMPYDPITDLAPVALVSQSMNVLVVPAALPVSTMQELLSYAKNKPQALNYGSSGNGGTTHLAGELFNVMAGTSIMHIPYQGSGPAMVDLLANRVQMMFDNLPSAMPYIQRGELKALGVTGGVRSQQLPDVPTIAENGLPGFEATTWFGIFAPAGTPEPVLERLNASVNAIMRTDAMQERLATMAAFLQPKSRKEFAELVRQDTEKWAKVIREANISLDN